MRSYLIHRKEYFFQDWDTLFPEFVVRNNGLCEPAEQDYLLSTFLNNNLKKICIDAGAHVGVYSIFLSTLFERVYAFEANPDNFECLICNTADEGNIEIFNVALGEANYSVLSKPHGHVEVNSGMYTVEKLKTGEITEGAIPCITIDSLELKGLDFLKMDVEGYEANVIKGASETIERFNPLIMLESNITESYHGFKEGTAIQMLLGMGYEIVHNIGVNYFLSRRSLSQ